MFERLFNWLWYNADGPWWCYILLAVGVGVLIVVVVELIREKWFT